MDVSDFLTRISPCSLFGTHLHRMVSAMLLRPRKQAHPTFTQVPPSFSVASTNPTFAP